MEEKIVIEIKKKKKKKKNPKIRSMRLQKNVAGK